MLNSLTPHDLLRLQFTLQCIGVEAGDRLVRISGPDPDGIPRYYVARFPDGAYETFYAAELSDSLVERLAALPPQRAFEDSTTVERILGESAPCAGVWMGLSYTFAQMPAAAEISDVVRLTAQKHGALAARYDPDLALDGRAAFAILRDGRIVASCVSSRENATAGEAWVRTEDLYRRRGYAHRVAAVWGAALLRAGKIAFYSHQLDNMASAGVARSLGLQPFVRDAGYL